MICHARQRYLELLHDLVLQAHSCTSAPTYMYCHASSNLDQNGLDSILSIFSNLGNITSGIDVPTNIQYVMTMSWRTRTVRKAFRNGVQPLKQAISQLLMCCRFL